MKLLVFCFIGTLCFALALSDDRCYSQTDCKEGQCCTGGLTPWLKGSCRDLSKEGELCDPDPPSTGKYFLRCPCESGFTCVSTSEVVSTTSPLCVRD